MIGLCAAVLLLAAALTLSPLGAGSSSAAARTPARVSAHLTKTSFKASEAAKVKLIYKFSSRSTRLTCVLSRKQGAKWVTVRTISYRGKLTGSRTMTVKQLFAAKQMSPAQYRVRLSAQAGSVTLTFTLTKPGAPAPSAPGAFHKTAPASGASGQSSAPTLNWTPSAGATSYQYCVDSTNNNICDGPWLTSALTERHAERAEALNDLLLAGAGAGRARNDDGRQRSVVCVHGLRTPSRKLGFDEP